MYIPGVGEMGQNCQTEIDFRVGDEGEGEGGPKCFNIGHAQMI